MDQKALELDQYAMIDISIYETLLLILSLKTHALIRWYLKVGLKRPKLEILMPRKESL